MSQDASTQSSDSDAVQLPLPAEHGHEHEMCSVAPAVQQTLTAVTRQFISEGMPEGSGPELRDRVLLAIESECEEMTVPDVREFRVTTDVDETASYPDVLRTVVREVLPHVFGQSVDYGEQSAFGQ